MRKYWTACILLSTALSSSAVTLGRHSGAAIIGRPLDVRVQVLLASGEDLTNLCIETDVFYGDSQVVPSAVRTSPQRTAPGADASVRVQSSLPVNEPFVTLYVRAGCGTQFTRRFVLLADLTNEPITAVTAPPQPLSGAATLVQNTATVTGVAGASAPLPRAAGAAPAPKASPVRIQPAPPANVARPAPVVRRQPRASVAVAPRLQLDPIDVSIGIEREPSLKLSPLLLSEPSASEEARAAASALWKSINASPEEILREAQKLVELESELGRLRTEQTRTAAATADLNAQLERAQAQRYQNWLVYLLGGALLLALLAVLLAWRRREAPEAAGSEESRAWWSPEDEKTVLMPLSPRDARSNPSSSHGHEADSVDVDVDVDFDQDSGFGQGTGGASSSFSSDRSAGSTSPVATRDQKEFASSAIGISRSVATEELFDVQQQADFFVSLGEDEQAIQVLRDHLMESHEPSALTYLDLFHIYHRMGRRSDYESLREEFNHVFNAGAPPFDNYSRRGKGLESYETAFSRIQALWPQPRVLDLIEQSIFRDASDHGSEVFDLEAYRELLMLHAIAKDLIQRDTSAAATSGGDFQHTAMQPLKAAGKAAAVVSAPMYDSSERLTEPMGLGDVPRPSTRLGIDINLDEISELTEFEASLPSVITWVEPSADMAQELDFEVIDINSNHIDFEVLDLEPPGEKESNQPP